MHTLEVKDLHTYYGDSYILQGISLTVPPGSIVAVLGRNGVGKTTLISSITGTVKPRSGSIFLEGRDVVTLPPFRRAQRGMALVPQGRHIFSSLSTLENLLVAKRKGNKDGEWSVEAVLDLFPRLRDRLGNRGNELSGGEQQMLAIARALVSNPSLLLLDEPTEGLSPLVCQELYGIIKSLKKEALGILLVEQNLRFALRVCDYVYLLSKGVVALDCTPDKLWNDRESIHRHLGIFVEG